MQAADGVAAAKQIWQKWAEVEKHVPHIFRKGVVVAIDSKLHEKGYPSLRELVA